MFRTRDFILLFTTIAFLLSAIGVTVLKQQNSPDSRFSSNEALKNQLASVASVEYDAVIATREGLNRAERIASMREKIAQSSELQVSEPELPVVIDFDSATTSEEELFEVTVFDQCSSYASYSGFWDARNLSVIESEGMIVVVRLAVSATGTSTETNILQLPKRFSPAPDKSCIASDVIGIANDGSLIRNDELGLYSVFSSDTRIGYALDGFEIYGTGNAPVDECGGRTESGQYRYELQAGNEFIINCFSAAPTTLP